MGWELSTQRLHSRLALTAVLFIAVCALLGSFQSYSQARKELRQRDKDYRMCDAQHRVDKEGARATAGWLVGQAQQVKAVDPVKIEMVRENGRRASNNLGKYLSCRSAVDSSHPYEKYRWYALILFFCGIGLPAVFVAVALMRKYLFIEA
jgi:hypothetical protein